MQSKLNIGFVGAGKMATALAKGFVQAKVAPARQIMASDVAEAAREAFAKAIPGVRVAASNFEVMKEASVLVLAVKPDQVEGVLKEVRPLFTDDHLLISIAAGVSLTRLQAALGENARIARVMPNTPALVGAAACGFALGKAATREDGQLVHHLLSAVGTAYQVKESLLDAVTGLSGSGPAYVFLMIEALSDGGVAAGLPRDVATHISSRTDPTWPETYWTPRDMTSFEYMSRIGPNHDANSLGLIGADLVTLNAMLRIPVDMHNLPKDGLFRPTLWDRFGGDDFRACEKLGPLYV